MDKYINKSETVQYIKQTGNNIKNWTELRYHTKGFTANQIQTILSRLADKIDEMPAADVRPIIYARWVYVRLSNSGVHLECSNCNEESLFEDFDEAGKICPICGAMMIGEMTNGDT